MAHLRDTKGDAQGTCCGYHLGLGIWGRWLEEAEIDKTVTQHKLRHTYATRLLEAGTELVDIQALLGHMNLATTQICTHVSEERMANIVSKL